MSDRDISEITRLVGIAIQGINELRERADNAQKESAEFRQEVNQRLDKVEQRLDKVDQRFEAVDQRFDEADQRFDALRQEMNQNFDALRQEMNQRFDQTIERLEKIEDQTKLMQLDIYDVRARTERTNQRVNNIEEQLRDKAA